MNDQLIVMKVLCFSTSPPLGLTTVSAEALNVALTLLEELIASTVQVALVEVPPVLLQSPDQITVEPDAARAVSTVDVLWARDAEPLVAAGYVKLISLSVELTVPEPFPEAVAVKVH